MTRIPIKVDVGFDEEFHKSIVYFPLVGFVIGLISYIVGVLGNLIFDPFLTSILIVACEVIVTGGLHIDGLGDTFDAIYSNRDKERMLEIMKDSRLGTNSLLAILFLVLIKMIEVSWFFIGIEELKLVVVRNTVIKLLMTSSIFIFIKDTNDFYLYILINVITSLVGNIVLVNSLKQYVSTPNVNKERVRYHLSKSWKFLIPQFSILIYTSLDKVILGNLANMTEVAYYDQSQKIIRIAVSLVSSVGVALLPRMTYLAQNNKKEEFDNLLTKSLNNVLLVSIYIVTVIICVSPNFVDWFFSKEYRNMALLMQIVSPIGVFIPIATILWNTVLIPNKLDNIAIKSAIYCAIMSVILNTLLDKNLGALGAIITLLVVEFYGMSYRIYHSRKYYNFKILIPSLCKYLGAGIFSYICVILFTGFMKSSIISTVIIGIISTIVYFLILIAMKDKLLLSYLEKVKMRLKRGELNDKKII